MDFSCPSHSGGSTERRGGPQWNVEVVGAGTEGSADRSKAAESHQVSVGQPTGLPPVE